MKKASIYLELIIIYLFFLTVALFYRGDGLEGNMDKILSMTTFLFAIILGFSTANRKQRLNSIRSLLRKNDAIILSIYEASKMYGDTIVNKTRLLIDKMLIAQIDYSLRDFDKTTPELIDLFDHSYELKVKNEDKSGKDTMMSGAKELLMSQKEIIYWIKDRMMLFEWISLLILCSIILVCIYSLSDGTALSIVVLPLISTAVILLLLVIRDIDNLSWQEDSWIWNRLIDLFNELDLPPYLLNVLFKNKRLNKNKLNLPKEYRLVDYRHPYPNFEDKVVTIIKDR